jgi:hypothetical protein
MSKLSRVSIMTAILLAGITLGLPGLRSRRAAAQSMGLTGSYGFSAAVSSQGGNGSNSFAILGVITFDGAGKLTGSETLAVPDPNPGATTLQTQQVPFGGTYTVNADGTGVMMLQFPGASQSMVSFVITDGGAGVMFLQTGGSNSLLTGTARKQ